MSNSNLTEFLDFHILAACFGIIIVISFFSQSVMSAPAHLCMLLESPPFHTLVRGEVPPWRARQWHLGLMARSHHELGMGENLSFAAASKAGGELSVDSGLVNRAELKPTVLQELAWHEVDQGPALLSDHKSSWPGPHVYQQPSVKARGKYLMLVRGMQGLFLS